MIVVTGAAGFISSCLVQHLNEQGYKDIVLVDDFSFEAKKPNFTDKLYVKKINRADFLAWFEGNQSKVSVMFHLGARTDTTEKETAIFDELNVSYTKAIWNICAQANIPMIYASSAATYGIGEHGYDDNHEIVEKLQPLNPYGVSKNDFDKWALVQKRQPPKWIGMKFFNVYGPNEYHKGRMASVIMHTVKQIRQNGSMKLFRSHNDDYEDGYQLRDFVYVKDIVKICTFFMENEVPNGLYNLGTGTARSFWDLATNTFIAMGLEPKISFIDIPSDIRETYQYFTEANIAKLRAAGYNAPFYTLEEGIQDYVQQYLMDNKIW